MDISLLLIRLVLAAVFAVAGLAKLADRAGSRQAMLNFGVPAVLANPLGTLLPLAELVVAIALLFIPTAWWGAMGALGLLLFFIAGISVNLLRGRTPDCHCFGQLYSQPIGWPTLLRNGVLALLAALVVWQGPENVGLSVTGWITTLTGMQLAGLLLTVVLVAFLAAEGWLLLHLLRQNGRLLLRVEALEAQLSSGKGTPQTVVPATDTAKKELMGLPIGAAAPSFQLPDLQEKVVALERLRAAGKPVLLVFSDPTCGPCLALMPKLAEWQRTYAASLTVAIISRGSAKDNRAKSSKHRLATLLLQQNNEVSEQYKARGTPAAVLILPDGKIGSHVAGGAPEIQKLFEQAIAPKATVPLPVNGHQRNGTPTVASGIPVGSSAPAFQLPDLNGNAITSSALLGAETVFLFWNPGCGFCARMLNELKQWESRAFEEKPNLVLLATGSAEANRALGLQSPILLDNGSAVSRQFGSRGTPSAVRLNSKGQIVSPLAIGAENVFGLLNSPAKVFSES